MGFYGGNFAQMQMAELNNCINRFGANLNFIPNLRGGCGNFGGNVNFFIPSGINCGCNNPLYNLNFIGLPRTYGDAIGLDAGIGFPNYLNGTFTPFMKSMAFPFISPNLANTCRCGGFNPAGVGQPNLLNDLTTLIALRKALGNLKTELNNNGKLRQRVIEPRYDDSDDVADDIPDDTDDVDDTSDSKDVRGQTPNKGVTKPKAPAPAKPKNNAGNQVKLTSDLSSKREEIINGVKNTWYGTRDQWSEVQAISKMESLDDDTFIAMFGDGNYAEQMAKHLCSGSNADGVMAYIVKRLHSLAPKDVKIYADTDWADSFVVSKSDIRPGYAHELQYCDNIMDGFANGVDIYEGDFARTVTDLGRYIRESRYN